MAETDDDFVFACPYYALVHWPHQTMIWYADVIFWTRTIWHGFHAKLATIESQSPNHTGHDSSKTEIGSNELMHDCLEPRAIPASVEKKLLRMRRRVGVLACGTSNQGLESSFCCWYARRRFAQQNSVFLTDTGTSGYAVASATASCRQARFWVGCRTRSRRGATSARRQCGNDDWYRCLQNKRPSEKVRS